MFKRLSNKETADIAQKIMVRIEASSFPDKIGLKDGIMGYLLILNANKTQDGSIQTCSELLIDKLWEKVESSSNSFDEEMLDAGYGLQLLNNKGIIHDDMDYVLSDIDKFSRMAMMNRGYPLESVVSTGNYLMIRYKSKPYSDDSAVKKQLVSSILWDLNILAMHERYYNKNSIQSNYFEHILQGIDKDSTPDNLILQLLNLLVRIYHTDIFNSMTKRFITSILTGLRNKFTELSSVTKMIVTAIISQIKDDEFWPDKDMINDLCAIVPENEIITILKNNDPQNIPLVAVDSMVYAVADDYLFIPLLSDS